MASLFEQGAFVEPVACAVRVAELVAPRPVDSSEIQLLGSFAYSAQNFAQALHLLASGKVGIKPEWTVLADLAEGAQWHERLLGDAGPVAKVLLTPGGRV